MRAVAQKKCIRRSVPANEQCLPARLRQPQRPKIIARVPPPSSSTQKMQLKAPEAMALRMEGNKCLDPEPSLLKRFLPPLSNSRGSSHGPSGFSSAFSKRWSTPLRSNRSSETGAVRKVMSRVFGLLRSKSSPEPTVTIPIRSKFPDRDWENIRYPPSPPPKQMKLTKRSFDNRVWFHADGGFGQGEEPSFTRSRIVKRRRASNEIDTLYDIRKRKRSRRETALSQ